MRKSLAAVLTLIELLVLFGASAGAIFFLQPYGHRGWTALAVAAILTFLLLGLTRKSRLLAPIFIRPGRNLARFLRLGAKVLFGTLTCWLGLIGWSSLSAGGALPPAKPDAGMIRVVTWNILHGTEHGAPWNRFGWSVRRGALESTLGGTMPDILCVQEALEEQVNDLANMRVEFGHVGVGRDDGRSAGEFCAIFFDRKRFDELDGGTFWLEEPTDLPPLRTIFGPKRICTWVRLRDRQSGRFLRVYNTHLYLTERARLGAVRIILARIALGEPADAVLVAGDFNAPPKTANRLLFDGAGLKSSAELMSDLPSASTYQFYGIRLSSLDDILVNREWRVDSRRVLDVKPGNTFPSDHFGVMTDLVLARRAAQSE